MPPDKPKTTSADPPGWINGDPTPETIQAEAAKIRRGWSRHTRWSRLVVKPERVELVEVRADAFGGR